MTVVEADTNASPNVLQEDIELPNGTPAVRTSTVYTKGEEEIKYTVEIKTENGALLSFMISVCAPDEEAAKDLIGVSEEERQSLFLEA